MQQTNISSKQELINQLKLAVLAAENLYSVVDRVLIQNVERQASKK